MWRCGPKISRNRVDTSAWIPVLSYRSRRDIATLIALLSQIPRNGSSRNVARDKADHTFREQEVARAGLRRDVKLGRFAPNFLGPVVARVWPHFLLNLSSRLSPLLSVH